MEEKPNYYAIIPSEVRYSTNLKDKAKLLYGEISALCNKEGYCYANNKYFADLYRVSTRTITDLISDLLREGFIQVKIDYKEGTKQISKRKIYLWKKSSIPLEENFYTPLEEIFQDNNINNNNINNNKYIVEILDYLNSKTNSNYKTTTKSTIQKINARFKEGFTLEDFKKVIDKKTDEWMGTELEQYLRPDTLFGTKFESYLNQNIIKKQKQETRYEREKRLLEEMCKDE